MKLKSQKVYNWEFIEARSDDPGLSVAPSAIKRAYEIWRSEAGWVDTKLVCKRMNVSYEDFIEYASKQLQNENPSVQYPIPRKPNPAKYTPFELQVIISNQYEIQPEPSFENNLKDLNDYRSFFINLYKKQRLHDKLISRPAEIDSRYW